MGKPKHTPGPWYVGRGGSRSGIVADDGEVSVAVVLAQSKASTERANAQLIAAAPAMLEALEAIDEVTDTVPDDIRSEAEEAMQSIWELTRAALAAARGDSPSPNPNN